MSFIHLAIGLFAVLLAGTSSAVVPRIIVEAEIDPLPSIWVNMQLGLRVRLLHAVDVSSTAFPLPAAPRAEIVAIGAPVVGETFRNGLRYRSHEQLFSVTPFASGPMNITAAVRGKSPAGLAETGGNSRWEMAAEPLVITVRPAEGNHQWLPARQLRIFPTPARLPEILPGESVSVLWTIEAEGVAPSALPDPNWETDGLVVLAEPAVRSSRNIRNGKDWTTVASRQQRVNYQPTRAGDFTLPSTSIIWWDSRNGRETTTKSEPLALTVRLRSDAGLVQPEIRAASSPGRPAAVWYSGAIAMLVFMLLWKPTALLIAVIGNHPTRGRRWLLSLTESGKSGSLSHAREALDAHCFGPSPTEWRLACIAALPALCRQAIVQELPRSAATLAQRVSRRLKHLRHLANRSPAVQEKAHLPPRQPARYRKPRGR